MSLPGLDESGLARSNSNPVFDRPETEIDSSRLTRGQARPRVESEGAAELPAQPHRVAGSAGSGRPSGVRPLVTGDAGLPEDADEEVRADCRTVRVRERQDEVARTMYGWRPPRYGPSNPSACNRRTSSGYATGPSRSPPPRAGSATGLRVRDLGRLEPDAADGRDREAAAEPDAGASRRVPWEPGPTLLFRPARGPDALEAGDLGVPRLLVLDLLEPGGGKGGGDVLDDHC